MGYRGKTFERRRARELRAEAWTLHEIAAELGVSKSSVSVWVRDVDFVPRPRNRGHPAGPKHPMRVKKEAELARCRAEAATMFADVDDRDLLLYGLALYVGEGAKTERSAVRMTNTAEEVMVVFMKWLRTFFEIDEGRLRARLYLHDGLSIDQATEHWSTGLGIPREQFQRPHRPPSALVSGTKHEHGCATVIYSCLHTHRRVMAMVEAVTLALANPG